MCRTDGKEPEASTLHEELQATGSAENERNDPQERTALVILHQMAGPENICVSVCVFSHMYSGIHVYI